MCKHYLIVSGEKNNYWLGAFNDDRWKWITGEDFSYSNWDYGQPDAYKSQKGSENYLMLYKNKNPYLCNSKAYKWNDTYSDGTLSGQEGFFDLKYYGFICEWEDSDKNTGNADGNQDVSQDISINSGFDFALFTGNKNNDIALYTGNTYINGDVHSNKGFHFQGNKLELNGLCETVQNINANTSSSLDSYVNIKKENVEERQIPQFGEYAYEYLIDKADVYDNWQNFNSGNVELSNSIVCKEGVQFNSNTFVGQGTVYAKDSITYNVGSLATAENSRVFMLSESGDIIINGTDIEINGILYAPNGVAKINANSFRINGRIIADRFEFNGTTLYINKGENDLDFIKWLFAPDITLNISGEFKVNRKVVLDISDSSEINRIDRENVVWSIKDENGEEAVIAVELHKP